jgi:catechol 2,3-dioxygenase-like lactoylglutathione lyase family enzyme
VSVNVQGITWLGTRTPAFGAMVAFHRDVMELELVYEEQGFAVFQCPNGDLVEVFGSEHDREHLFFSTGPVAGFHVDDVDGAKAEMERAGVEFIGKRGSSGDGYAWWHFRAPDGNVYEIVSRPR